MFSTGMFRTTYKVGISVILTCPVFYRKVELLYVVCAIYVIQLVPHINLKLIDKYEIVFVKKYSSDFKSQNIIMFAKVYLMKIVKGCIVYMSLQDE